MVPDSKIEDQEWYKLPYLTHIPGNGRRIPISFFYDHAKSRWQYWVVEDGSLHHLDVELVDGIYLSSRASSTSDYRMPFDEVMLKHFTLPEMADLQIGISHDLVTTLRFIEKYFILLHYGNVDESLNASGLIQGELEGLFGVYRSFFDLLNRVVMKMLARYERVEVYVA